MYEGEKTESKDRIDKALEQVAKELAKERIINIYEGWSNDDESDSSRYWMFSAELPIPNAIAYTGWGGLIRFLQDTPYLRFTFIYNGMKIPSEENEKFLEYINRKR
jgi:hypothetical protein